MNDRIRCRNSENSVRGETLTVTLSPTVTQLLTRDTGEGARTVEEEPVISVTSTKGEDEEKTVHDNRPKETPMGDDGEKKIIQE